MFYLICIVIFNVIIIFVGTGICWRLRLQSLPVSMREGDEEHFVVAGGEAAEVQVGGK